MLILSVFVLVRIAESIWPWWGLAPAALLAGALLGTSAWRSARAGFAGVASVWLASSLYSHWSSGGILTGAMADILLLPGGAAAVFAVTVLLGGAVGALAAASGCLLGHRLREAVRRRDQPESAPPA